MVPDKTTIAIFIIHALSEVLLSVRILVSHNLVTWKQAMVSDVAS